MKKMLLPATLILLVFFISLGANYYYSIPSDPTTDTKTEDIQAKEAASPIINQDSSASNPATNKELANDISQSDPYQEPGERKQVQKVSPEEVKAKMAEYLKHVIVPEAAENTDKSPNTSNSPDPYAAYRDKLNQ